MTTFLGQILPPIETNQPHQTFTQICSKASRVKIFVASANALKVNAAQKAVEIWAKTFLDNVVVEAKGFESPSGIDEQPHGRDYTKTGASNRLTNLRKAVEDQLQQDDAIHVLMAMENGLMEEEVENLRNPDRFQTSPGKAWIDRCIVVGQIIFGNNQWDVEAISEGVTTPKDCVEESKMTNWAKTAGSFIEKTYGWNAKDWHKDIAGKSRQDIMQEVNLAALGIGKK